MGRINHYGLCEKLVQNVGTLRVFMFSINENCQRFGVLRGRFGFEFVQMPESTMFFLLAFFTATSRIENGVIVRFAKLKLLKTIHNTSAGSLMSVWLAQCLVSP